jgi:putative heme-binding domain-containing protein
LLLLTSILVSSVAAIAEDKPAATNFFLPQNPIAAAYVLGRLSNRELTDAPRSEFVYSALLQRKGLERKYRAEALEGLASIRHSSALDELLKAIADLDKKGEESEQTLQELGAILQQSSRSDLRAKHDVLDQLALQSRVALTRQIAWAARVIGDGSTEPAWSNAAAKPAQLEDLVLGLPLILDASLRAQAYAKVKPLLLIPDPPTLRRAAIVALVALPSHDTESFDALSKLVQNGIEMPATIRSLGRIPKNAWPKDLAAPLSEKVVDYLRQVPPGERTESPFANALQFATELASLLPPETERALLRILRNLGPTIVTLHAVYEQMRFDKELIATEPGKPVVINLQNDDAMPHNLAILAPGALKEIGLAAEKMPPDPDAQGRLYVPASPKVLYATKLAAPGQKVQLAFDAPAEPGDYPFVCTFPGHWLRMAGNLAVVQDVDAYLAAYALTHQPKFTEWKLADLVPDLPQSGVGRDAQTGRELFSKLACAQCHKLGEQGYAFGPELTDVFKRYKGDRAAILQQILEPSKVIEDRYRNFNFEMKNGDPVLGLVLKEDDQALTIQTGPADSLIQTVKKSEIQQRRAQASSPMPVGLLNALSKNQIFDLLAYLESGGEVPSHEHMH